MGRQAKTAGASNRAAVQPPAELRVIRSEDRERTPTEDGDGGLASDPQLTHLRASDPVTLQCVDRVSIPGEVVGGLFEPGLPNRALLDSVIEGRCNAAIVLDDQDAPSHCLVRTGFYGFAFYAGPRDGFLEETVTAMRGGSQLILV